MVDYTKLVAEKEKERDILLKKMNLEVQELRDAAEAHQRELNEKYFAKIEKYLTTVSDHLFVRADLKETRIYTKIAFFTIPGFKNWEQMCYVQLTWSDRHEKIDVHFYVINHLTVNGSTLRTIKNKIFRPGVEWKSIESRPAIVEGFSRIKNVAKKHFRGQMKGPELEILNEWIRSYISDYTMKVVKVNNIAREFGI